MFVDRVEIQLEAGRGGDGCVSFRREKYVPRGGPDGGDGGRGGSITLVAQDGVDSLAALSHRKHWRATSGERGHGANCHGRDGEDLVLQVPPGTVVRDAAEGYVIKDLAQAGDSVVAARSGRGGKGNTHFKSATHRTPREATPGEPGEVRRVVLELKVIADVGLVGKPNAGKSTLLSRVTRARPQIADYPFTTKYPNLGRVQLDWERSFVLADIPGLVEGASHGVGLGHEFLRHIERAGILVHLIEPQPADGSDPIENYRAIRRELEEYDVDLGRRPEIVAVTKADLPEAGAVRDELAAALDREVHLISAVTGRGLDVLLREIDRTLRGRLAAAEQH
jgi:GTP-binding protein